MDFWDLAKLLARRWSITAPLLVITGLATVFILQDVKPDYIATTSVQLIPPNPAPSNILPSQEKNYQNPYVDLGLDALMRAASLSLQGKATEDGLKAAGLSKTYTVTNSDFAPSSPSRWSATPRPRRTRQWTSSRTCSTSGSRTCSAAAG
ncbi:hypothetical protein ACFQX7_08480 [Luedemannella flava]